MQFYNLFFTLVLGIVQFVCKQYLNRLSNTASINISNKKTVLQQLQTNHILPKKLCY